jgi:dUTP pyrophosphatase
MKLNIKIKPLHPRAKMPTMGSAKSNCFDLRAVFDGEPVVIPPGGQAKFDTGLIFEYPEGWSMDVFSRSGMGFNKRVRLSNGTGIIDEDFRDTVKVALHNDSDVDFVVIDGDRICQARLVETHQYTFEVVDQISETSRGTGGIGSTGTA